MVWAGGRAAAEPEAVAELGLELGQGPTLSSGDQEGQKRAHCPTEVWTVGESDSEEAEQRALLGWAGPGLLYSLRQWGMGWICLLEGPGKNWH